MKSLQGQLLVAAPSLIDPNFFRTVIFLVQHSEEGALGLVLNRATGTAIREAWQQVSESVCLREGGSLLATASRRTPESWKARLRASRGAVPGLRWIGAADGGPEPGDPPANPYRGMLAWADRVVGTPDSVNMLSEAAATSAPLFVAWPERQRGRPRGFVDTLLASGRARRLDATLSPFPVEPLRETARVAAEVRELLRF